MASDGTMSERACARCGHPGPANANFCAECGASMAPEAPPNQVSTPASPERAGAGKSPLASAPATSGTLMHFGPVQVPPPAEPVAAVRTGSSLKPAGLQRTMLGFPQTPGVPALGTPAADGRAASAIKPNQTVLGVAIPGIAPLRAGEPAKPAQAPLPSNATQQTPWAQRTVQAPAPVVAPPPEPLPDLPPPRPPKIVRKGGVALSVVALVTGALVLVFGVAVAWLWRGAAPITAQATSAPDGKDTLLLHCDPRSCRDGTTVEAEGARAVFSGGEAELPLPNPLRVGANPLSLRIDRPGRMRRSEVVRLVVPVAYRIRADATPMRDVHPNVVIDVEATPGSDVLVDGRDVPLDATGAGKVAIDESAVAEGPADESRTIPVKLDYSVAIAGSKQPAVGTISARVSIAPLRIDVPGSHAVIDRDQFVLAGRAAKGANVTVDGTKVESNADGSFETEVAVPALGERTVDVRADGPLLSPRTVRVAVKRVVSLAAEAADLQRRRPVGYDAIMADIAGAVGKPTIVEGEVIDARTVGRRTVALVDDRRGCARGPCLARVIVSGDGVLTRGKVVRAFGTVARAYTSSTNQAVPEIEADFVLPAMR